MTIPDRDNRLFSRLINLRRHLIKCDECRQARAALSMDRMCHDGKLLTVTAADEFDVIIELRRKALVLGDEMVFPCPDTAAHGQAYALSVKPCRMVAIQDSLF